MAGARWAPKGWPSGTIAAIASTNRMPKKKPGRGELSHSEKPQGYVQRQAPLHFGKSDSPSLYDRLYSTMTVAL